MILTLGTPAAHGIACEAEYKGPVGGSWASASNWTPETLPKATQFVCIPAGKGAVEVPATNEGKPFKAEADYLLDSSTVHILAGATLEIAETGANLTAFSGLTIDATGTLATKGGKAHLSGASVVNGTIAGPTTTGEKIQLSENGVLSGSGTIQPDFVAIGTSTIFPGGQNTVGTLTFDTHFGTGGENKIVIDLESPSSFDTLSVGGVEEPSLNGGTVEAHLIDGYIPTLGQEWEFIKGGTHANVGGDAVLPEGPPLGRFSDHSTTKGGALKIEELPTKPALPSVLTVLATAIAQTSATLGGTVNPNGSNVTSCEFEYGPTTAYGQKAACLALPGAGSANVAVSSAVSGLTPGTTYHFRLLATNGGGTRTGNDESFKTVAGTGGSTSGGTTKGGGSPGGSEEHVASTPKAVEELALGCSGKQLVLNDVYIHGSRVAIEGSAAKSLVGKTVKILFNEKKQVATATVQPNGTFATTAPLPPKRIREAVSTRYSATLGALRTLHLKLTRRLLLEPPKASGATVTLSGIVTPPLTKPAAAVVVEEQLECGRTTIAKRFTPPANGRFHITLSLPAGAKAAIFRLTSSVAANSHATKHGFNTFSLPLPLTIG